MHSKGGEPTLSDNYCPVSLLPVFSKVLERFMYKKLVSHLDKNNSYYAKQFGFRSGHSTSDAFLVQVGEILKSFTQNFHLLSVFIDLKKAFDMVDHEIILSKLERIGIRGTSLQWFHSYLTNRFQLVRDSFRTNCPLIVEYLKVRCSVSSYFPSNSHCIL